MLPTCHHLLYIYMEENIHQSGRRSFQRYLYSCYKALGLYFKWPYSAYISEVACEVKVACRMEV